MKSPNPVAFLLLGGAGWLLVAPAAADTVTISRADCLRIVRHVPAGDVTYQPGVDARGRPVAPADVEGAAPPLRLPETITFDIAVDMRRYLGGPADDARAASSAAIAADKAKTAVQSAADAAATATTAAQRARDVASALQSDAETASLAADAAQAASDAAPLDPMLRAAAATARSAAAAAASEAQQAASAAAAVETSAARAQSLADTADAASSADARATVASSAAVATRDTASLAAAMAGTPQAGEDATVTTLRSAADSATTAAQAAAAAAEESAGTNTELIQAHRDAQKYGNLDASVGTVRYDHSSGQMTFNGQPLTDADRRAVAEACRQAYGNGR